MTAQELAALQEDAQAHRVCTCRSFRFPHDVKEHKKLLNDYDWRTYEQRQHQRVFEERVK